MAWRSGGSTNDEMVDNLKRFGVISSDAVERGFRAVDRRFFVPKGNEEAAHADQPLKEGNVHISAPHIYDSALEALELEPDSSLSFLNVGSGTGYLSCVVAEILGPKSVNFGVEIHEDVVSHCCESVEKWRRARKKRACGRKRQSDSSEGRKVRAEAGATSAASCEKNGANADDGDDDAGGPHLHFIRGNGLNISSTSGESVVGFDRIYVGAAVDRSDLPKITKLLCPGGILVGPVDDELTKIVRIGPLKGRGRDVSDDSGDQDASESDDDEEGRNSNNEFTRQVLSGVRFAPLLIHPVTETVIPARGWAPDRHRYFPETFQKATMELLMCSNATYSQPPPQPKKVTEFVNVAAMLPRVMWIEVLSFTHRKWFEPEQTETAYLKQRLLEEQANAAKAQQARIEAEARCHVAERERDVYRILARRWQSRLHLILQQQRQAAAAAAAVSAISSAPAAGDSAAAARAAAVPIDDSLASDSLVVGVGGDEAAALLGLNAVLRQIAGEGEGEDIDGRQDGLLLMEGHDVDEDGSDDDGAEEEDDDEDEMDMDVDETPRGTQPFGQGQGAPRRAKSIDDDSVSMSEVENSAGQDDFVARDARTVSVSSDDL